MKSCLTSLRSLVIVLGLAVSTTGCFAQTGADADADVDADADTIEALPGSDTQNLEETDPTTDDSGTPSPEDDETGSPDTDPLPTEPEPPPGGLCTTPSCTQV